MSYANCSDKEGFSYARYKECFYRAAVEQGGGGGSGNRKVQSARESPRKELNKMGKSRIEKLVKNVVATLLYSSKEEEVAMQLATTRDVNS